MGRREFERQPRRLQQDVARGGIEAGGGGVFQGIGAIADDPLLIAEGVAGIAHIEGRDPQTAV